MGDDRCEIVVEIINLYGTAVWRIFLLVRSLSNYVDGYFRAIIYSQIILDVC